MAKYHKGMSSMPYLQSRIYIYYLLSIALAFAVPAAAQTNVYPLYSSGVYSGGTGDMTNITGAQLKLAASTGYVRVPHLSQNTTISTVYNFETGKDVYWGEPADAGNYWFRGRNMLVQNGKVGINTATPQYPLDVAGHISCDDLIISNKYPGSTSLDMSVTAYSTTNAYDMIAAHTGWDPNAVYVAGFNAANASYTGWQVATQRVFIGAPIFNLTNYMVVDLVHGSVGIGTQNTNDPNNRLFVETGIRTRKVTVDNASWPDYVFNSGYRLLPLDSLGRFIAANHHLPEMPSADSIAKNGVELSASQSKLLKKVEELTLYLLQQQKEIDELEAENKRLAEEMAVRREQR